MHIGISDYFMNVDDDVSKRKYSHIVKKLAVNNHMSIDLFIVQVVNPMQPSPTKCPECCGSRCYSCKEVRSYQACPKAATLAPNKPAHNL